MQDQKNNSFIFSFSKLQIKFIKGALLFLAPVLIVMIVLEILVLEIPTNYTENSAYFSKEKNTISLLILGSSQMESAINPQFIKQKSISLASKSQHHDLDFPILTQLTPSIPNLKTVVFELSFSHLEIPHNGLDFWKHNIYLKYYGVNAFGRNTYFKDKLIFLSNTNVYSKLLLEHYIKNKKAPNYNRYGFDTTDFEGLFKTLNYNSNIIAKAPMRIRNEENLSIFKKNAAYFFKMLNFANEQGLQIVVATLPLNKNYLDARNPNILRRRDSVLKVAEHTYSNLRVLREEEDTINFNVKDFINHNHLNPSGAKKFSELLEIFVNESFSN